MNQETANTILDLAFDCTQKAIKFQANRADAELAMLVIKAEFKFKEYVMGLVAK